MSEFESFLLRRKRVWGEKFDSSLLLPKWQQHYNSGNRIEVRMKFGEILRGYVGVTSGWMPVFILLLRRNSRGSIWCLGPDDEVLKTIPGKNIRDLR